MNVRMREKSLFKIFYIGSSSNRTHKLRTTKHCISKAALGFCCQNQQVLQKFLNS